MKKYFWRFVSVAALFCSLVLPSKSGGVEAATTTSIEKKKPLILRHAMNIFAEKDKKFNIAYHYSHYSHTSHYSHSSHYSHASHYSHYSGL